MENAKPEEKAIAKAPPLIELTPGKGLVPSSFDGLWYLAQIMLKSGFTPKGISTVEQVVIAVAAGLDVGLSPLQAVQGIAPINGRPTVWGDTMLGIVQASGLLEIFKEEFIGTYPEDDFAAVCTVKRRGDQVVAIETFSVADAKEARLWGKEGPWQTYKKRMLRMRARSYALRGRFADVLKGIRSAEEEVDVVELVPDSNGSYSKAAENVREKSLGKMEALKARLLKDEDPDDDPHAGPGNGGGKPEAEPAQETAPAREEEEEAAPRDFLGEWKNLKGPGYADYVWKHLEDFKEASPGVHSEARDKWRRLYPGTTWPLDLDEAANGPEDGNEAAGGEPLPEPQAQAQAQAKQETAGNGDTPEDKRARYDSLGSRLQDCKDNEPEAWARACKNLMIHPTAIPASVYLRENLINEIKNIKALEAL